MSFFRIFFVGSLQGGILVFYDILDPNIEIVSAGNEEGKLPVLDKADGSVVPGLFMVPSSMIQPGGFVQEKGAFDTGEGEEDEAIAKENSVSGPSAFNYTPMPFGTKVVETQASVLSATGGCFGTLPPAGAWSFLGHGRRPTRKRSSLFFVLMLASSLCLIIRAHVHIYSRAHMLNHRHHLTDTLLSRSAAMLLTP